MNTIDNPDNQLLEMTINTIDNPDNQQLQQVAKAVFYSLDNCVSCLPCQCDVDQANPRS